MKMQEESSSDLEKYFSTTEAEETPEPVWEDGGEIFIGKFWTLDSVSEKSSFSKKITKNIELMFTLQSSKKTRTSFKLTRFFHRQFKFH